MGFWDDKYFEITTSPVEQVIPYGEKNINRVTDSPPTPNSVLSRIQRLEEDSDVKTKANSMSFQELHDRICKLEALLGG